MNLNGCSFIISTALPVGLICVRENIMVPEFRLHSSIQLNAKATASYNAPRARKGFDWWNLVGLSTPTDKRRIQHAARYWARLFPPAVLIPSAGPRATADANVAAEESSSDLKQYRLQRTGRSVWCFSETARSTTATTSMQDNIRQTDWHNSSAGCEENDCLIELNVLNHSDDPVSSAAQTLWRRKRV